MELTSDNKILNAIGFQLAWWLSALYLESSIFFVLSLVILHLAGLTTGFKNEFKFILSLATIGFLFDSVLVKAGVLSFGSLPTQWEGIGAWQFVPFWMVTLWLAFACTLNHSLSWVFRSPIAAFAIGSIAGPISYFSAEKLGALEILGQKETSGLILSALWGTLFVALSWFFNRDSNQVKTGI